VEVAAKVASILIGPGASRLVELEKQTRRRFYLQSKEGTHLDHFLVLAEGKRDDLAPPAPVAEGAKVDVQLVEVGLHDPAAGVGKVDGFDVDVAGAARQVGKKVKIQVERVLDGVAYATLVTRAAAPDAPITAEGEAEKPTRRTTAKVPEAETSSVTEEPEPEVPEVAEAQEPEVAEDMRTDSEAAVAAPKKKTRRGTRGGRGRKKKTAAAASSAENGAGEPEDVAPVAAKIHVPDPELGEPEATPAEPAEDGAEPPKPKKKTRRGSRGGRGRKKKTAAAVAATDGASADDSSSAEEKPSDWEYVPMSEWADDLPEN
jgi:predicted RNA-binding protein with TRAM domain